MKTRAILLELYAPDVYKTEDRHQRQYNKMVFEWEIKVMRWFASRCRTASAGVRARPSLRLTCSRNINETSFRCNGF